MSTLLTKITERKHSLLKLVVFSFLMFIPITLALVCSILCIPLMILYLTYQLIRISFLALLDWSLTDQKALIEHFREGFQQLKHHWTSGSWD